MLPTIANASAQRIAPHQCPSIIDAIVAMRKNAVIGARNMIATIGLDTNTI